MGDPRRLTTVAVSVGLAVVIVGSGLAAVVVSHRGASRFLSPRGLTVNGGVRPVGVDPDRLAFAWRVTDHRPGARQTEYRIVVARGANATPGSKDVVWDDTQSSAAQAFIAYRGSRLDSASEYWWTVQTTTVAKNGGSRRSDFAPPQPFVTGIRDSDWHAQWVRPGPAHPGAEEYTYLRKVVDLPNSRIMRATAYVAAAHQYQLVIGGRRVAAGPAYSYPDYSYYEATDVTTAFRAGAANAIGVLHYWSGPGQGRPASAPGLLLEIVIDLANGAHEVIGTDGTWREHPAEWLPAPPRNDEGGFTERVDGRLHPTGWTQPDFRATTWKPVAVIGPPGTAPFTHLVAQRTHIVQHGVKPVSVRTLPSGAVVADYGEVVAARPSVIFHHGVAGRKIHLRVGYALDRDGQVSTTHATQATDLNFTYIQRNGLQAFEAYTYLGYRYLQVNKPGEPLTAAQLVARARHAAMPDEDAASFTSSKPMLDKVWDLVRHSALYASQDQFVDTPTREKGQFLADAYNISLAVMHAFRDQNMTWQALQDFAQSQQRYWPNGNLNAVYPNGDGRRSFLDFTERYPDWLWQYYRQTGDRETLAQLYPVVTRVASYVHSLVSGRTGLVTYTAPEGYDLVDWPPAMQYGYDINTVAHTTANVLGAVVFDRAAQMATLLGKPDDARVERARRDDLVKAINGKLTRADGVYVDGLTAGGAQSGHASQQANAFALWGGIVPKAKVAAVADYVAGHGIRTGPMDGLFLLDALRNAGRSADVVRILTDTRHPGWAFEIVHGGTFTWESWILSDIQGDSMSHGWGSSALVAFQTAILGVSQEPMGAVPSGPVLDISGPAGGVSRVVGRVPTIAGPVTVHWQRTGESLALDLTVPPNATARVNLGDHLHVFGAGTHHLTTD